MENLDCQRNVLHTFLTFEICSNVRILSHMKPHLSFFGDRWVNLWPPQDFAESFTPGSGEESPSSDESDADQQDRGIEPEASSATGDLSSFVFMGNFVLFVALLTVIFLIHVALASGVEAYWIAKVRMLSEIWCRLEILFGSPVAGPRSGRIYR